MKTNSKFMKFKRTLKYFMMDSKMFLKTFFSERELIVGKGESRRRMEICLGCPYITKRKQRCSICGCFLKFKTKFTFENCPLGDLGVEKSKWDSIKP